jgi:DNA repair protein RecN (Recombination protein N)
MLLRLHIQDLAIIDSLTIDLSRGFTVLTGETGAGKSIILGALNLVLGERASSEDVRTGRPRAVVEALFDISGLETLRAYLAALNLVEEGASAGPDEALELVIRREVSSEGRSRCLVNGRLLPLGQLREIGDHLIDLHGQHQHQSLLKVELHREILDAFGGKALSRSLASFRELYGRYEEIEKRLRILDKDERELARQKDLLEYQLNEIDAAGLEPEEDETLEEEIRRLKHADDLLKNSAQANDLLFEGEVVEATAAGLIARGEGLLIDAARLDPSLQEFADRLASARAEIEDIASLLRSYTAGLEHNPARLAEAEDRIHLIRQLKSKYGASIEEILEERDRIEQELHTLTHSREEKERLEAERDRTGKDLVRSAENLSRERKRAGDAFSKGLRALLKELDMPEIRFEVRLDRELVAPAHKGADQDPDAAGADRQDRPGAGICVRFPDGRLYRLLETGVDRVEFLISPNRGEDLRPLRKIASGGELSRIMLSLKVLMRSLDQVPTLVFDEIDTGIGGKTGTRIGEKMADLGKSYQLLCITHLPQIAAQAGAHFAVLKAREGKRTLTRVERLEGDARLEEIARLLGGKADSPIARRHARELLAQ